MEEKMMEAMKGVYENLTDEQKEKAKACKSLDEVMQLLGDWGVELPDDLVEATAGGMDFSQGGAVANKWFFCK